MLAGGAGALVLVLVAVAAVVGLRDETPGR